MTEYDEARECPCGCGDVLLYATGDAWELETVDCE